MTHLPLLPAVSFLLAGSLLAGCASTPPQRPRPVLPRDGPAFADRSRDVGLDRIHYAADLRRGKIIATMGAGVAWGDYDGDGDLDLYVTEGVPRYRDGAPPARCGRLFRNEEDRFADRTSESGLAPCGWGSGAAFEDLDGDGDLDLFLTFVGENQLWRNDGAGRFVLDTPAVLAAPGYNCGVAFLDHDGDGDLDVYLTRYVATTIEEELAWPAFDLRMPEDYPAPPNVLLRRDPDGYTDVTEAAGVVDSEGRSLGVVAADFDRDGRADLFVANDRSRNTLFQNRGDGTFEDVTVLAGVGTGLDGQWESAMGTAIGDLDGDGFPELLVTNYVDEPNSWFENLGGMAFVDRTRERGLFEAAYDWVGWAAEIEDLDNDGRRDLYVVNGHILPTWIARLGTLGRRDELVGAYAKGGYRQPMLVFRGGADRFTLVPEALPEIPLAFPGRGAALADVDRDGRLDLFVHSLVDDPPARFLANVSPSPGRWVGVDLRSPAGPHPVPGVVVEALAQGPSGSRRHTAQVTSGGSYLSQATRPLHLGLGPATRVDLTVYRPDRPPLRLRTLPVDRYFALRSP